MKRLIVSTGCIAALLFSTSSVIAQGRGNGGPKVKPATGATAKGGGSAGHGGGGKAMGSRPAGSQATARGGQAKTHGPVAKTNTGGKPTTTANTGGPKTTGSKAKTTTTSETTTATTTPKKSTTSVAADTLSPVQLKLQRNTNLAKKLEGRLPASMTLMDAAADFGSMGKFVSAVNAAYNHDLDFVRLKTDILDGGMSLGQAMKEQRSTLDSTLATRAERDADALIKSTEGPLTASKGDTKTRSPKDSRQ